MKQAAPNTFYPEYHNDFSGGVNYYFGARQVEDKEYPIGVNLDFKGKNGVGNRLGYTQIGSLPANITDGYGLTTLRTASLNYLIAFLSNGSNIQAYRSTGGSWTAITGTFTDARNMDTVQAGDLLFTANGTDAMLQYDGSSWATTTGGKVGLYLEYYDKRLWTVDPSDPSSLFFSGQWAASSSKLGDFDSADGGGTVTFEPGSGKEIRSIKKFKDALYVFLFPYGIYRVTPASSANTFTVELITNSVGCIAHRATYQVEEDLFFATSDGVYSLGDVALYTAVRTTNKSSKIQPVFDSLSGTNREKLCAVYYNFKYHLFYSQFGSNNDSCVPFDIRYKAWQDWRNMAVQDATIYVDTTGIVGAYFLEKGTGKVMQLDTGTTDNGTVVSSQIYTKEFAQDMPDVMKLYFDTTFGFGQLNGSGTISVIFDDQTIGGTATISQGRPQGGFGRTAIGVSTFGKETNTITVEMLINYPLRIAAKGKKFTIQYRVSFGSGSWRLDYISQYYQVFSHFKFPANLKITPD